MPVHFSCQKMVKQVISHVWGAQPEILVLPRKLELSMVFAFDSNRI